MRGRTAIAIAPRPIGAGRHLIRALAVVLLAGSCLTPARAQSVVELQARIDAQDARIRELEAKLERLSSMLATAPVQAEPAHPLAPPVQAVAALPPPAKTAPASRLSVSGDLRVRAEFNTGGGVRDRTRGVMRGRLRATYALNDWLSAGGQLVTGDDEDPNSTDVTLGNFDDDLSVGLDQAYLRAVLYGGKLVAHLGKIPPPFVRTEMVWDGDVGPEGASATYRAPLPGGWAFRGSALYFIIDESAAAADSAMVGVQAGVQTEAKRALMLEAHAGYYDYALNSVAGADSGDFRTNRTRGGRYLSDFKLIDLIGIATWNGLGARWPVRVTGNYVRNLGAADHQSGLALDLAVGSTGHQADWRLSYGFADVDADAVFAAFAQDNISLASNYRQHSVSLEFVPIKDLLLSAVLYHYRPKDFALVAPRLDHHWDNRLRLNVMVTF